jgi:hypothetical protein
MRKRFLVGVLAAVAALATSVSGASANSDPHRTYLAAVPTDLRAGFCSFPVQLTYPVDREYGTIITTAGGATVIDATGALTVTATNLVTGKHVTVDASGPATFTVSADGTTEQLDGRGIGVFFAPNSSQLGLPSGLVQTSGPLHATIDTASQNITSLNSPHVLMDMCAAIG